MSQDVNRDEGEAGQNTQRVDRGSSKRQRDVAAIQEILDRVAALPVLDTRSADEIIGYNEFGLFDEEEDFSLTDIERA